MELMLSYTCMNDNSFYLIGQRVMNPVCSGFTFCRFMYREGHRIPYAAKYGGLFSTAEIVKTEVGKHSGLFSRNETAPRGSISTY